MDMLANVEGMTAAVVPAFLCRLPRAVRRLVLALVSGVTLCACANGEPVGWWTRGVTNAPMPDLENAPTLPAFRRQCVYTNAQNGASASLQSVPGPSGMGLPATLPASDDIRIRELARGLDHDWRRCYFFVRDHIAYAPYFGFLRGAARTLLDLEGSDADQALLLFSLLRVSGHDATVAYVPLTIADGTLTSGFFMPLRNSGGQFPCSVASWLDLPATGTDAELCARVIARLSVAGRSSTPLMVSGIPCVATDHFWVVLTVDGVTYHLDPSVKPTARVSERDVAMDMGYSRSSLLSSVGGTIDANSAKSLSASALAARLDAYSAALRAVWTNANAAASHFIGASSVVPQEDDGFFHGFLPSDAFLDVFRQTDTVKNQFRASVTLALGTLNRQFFLDELGMRHLWISFAAGSAAYPKAVLKLDDVLLASESAGAANASATMALSVAYAPASMSADYPLVRALSHVYAVPVGFGGDARGGMRTWATEELAKLRASGAATDDARMVGRALQVAGQQWLAQAALAARFRNRIGDRDRRLFYNIGVAGQAESPYVDMKNCFGYSTADPAAFDGGMLFSSALEHAVLDQLNGTNAPSVSTVRLLELAHAAGMPIYFADAANYATVRNALVGYTTAQKASFQNAVGAGRTLLLPKNASITLNGWTGHGYIEHGPASGGSYTTGMVIAGGMNGGFGTVDGLADAVAYTIGTQPTTTYANGGVPESTQADPVAMPSGAFLDSRTDLVVDGAVPLVWARRYDSRGRYDAGGLGRGWSHGYEAAVVECADPDAVFGGGSVDAAIPTAVAATVVDDLLAVQSGLAAGERARRLMAAALTVQWWTRHLVGATVSVNLGARSLVFQRRPDGTFAPYPGVTAALTRANGVYTLAERLGDTYRFNAAGRLASITDRSGNVTTLTYDATGNLTRVANAFGASFSVTWSGGRISRVVDNAGHAVAYAYSADGCLTKVTDPRSKNWTATYDAATFALLTKKNPENQTTVRNLYSALGQVTNQVAANGQSWTFGYVANAEAWDEDPLGRRLVQSYTGEGRVRRRTDRDGATTVYARDGHGHVVARTDAAGRTDLSVYDNRDNLVCVAEGVSGLSRYTDFVFDAANRLVAVTNALGQVTAFAHDSHDRLLSTTFPDGSVVTNTWNAKGLLTSERRRSADGTVLRETVYTYGTRGLPLTKTVKGAGLPEAGVRVATHTYSTAGLPLTVRDANGHTTTFTYDAAGHLLTTRDPADGMTRRTYTNAGRLGMVTDALGRTTTTFWTPSGKLAATLCPDGATTTNVYDAVDDLVSVTDARGATTLFTRDAVGRVVARTTASGTGHTTYDGYGLGLPVATVDAAGVATWPSYDWLYRPMTVQDALGRSWRTGYDLLDRVTTTTDPRGRVRTTSYDVRGRREATVRPSGATTRFVYDDLGNLASISNADGHVYRMLTDALGRRLSATDATGRVVETNVYDGAGNLLSRTDGNGTTLVFAYDVCDRLTRRSGPGFVESFAYDAVGNLVMSSNGTARTTFAYDAMDRLVAATSRIAGVSFPLVWRRDAGGLVTNLVYASGKMVTKSYDTDGRLVQVRDWLGHEWTFTHDGAGKPTGGTSPDGTTHAFSYDVAGRLAGWHAGALMGRTIERDAAGRRVRDTITAGPMPCSSVDRRAVNTFDAADRLVSASVTYAVTNAPVQETYLHDGNGAMTNIVCGDESVLSFAYDAQGRLAAWGGTDPDVPAGTVPDGATAFAYDATGNRVVADGRLWIPDYADPLKRPLIECDADGVPLRHYLWGDGRLLGFIDATNGLTVAHADEQGSVVALTTPEGVVLHTANYGPHGEDWGSTGENPTPFTWLGGHGVTRLSPHAASHFSFSIFHSPFYLTRHRLYSATLKRFLSTDPLGLAGGLNLYAYAEGNPLAYIDPLGLCAGSGEVGFFENLAVGATAGDFAGDTGWGGAVGQIGMGFVPVAGQIADARDTAAGIANVWNNPTSGEAWMGLAMSGAAWIPGIGDAAKAAYKGGRSVAKGVLNAAESSTKPLRTLQTGGHTLNSSTLRELGLSKEQGKRAIEALKTDQLIPSDSHGRILSNGDLLNSDGEYLGNIFQYLP